jgi:uncharacterized protein
MVFGRIFAVMIVGACGVFLGPGDAVADPTFIENMKKAKSDDARAQYKVGLAYAYGQGAEMNTEEAMYWYCQAAIQGNAIAQYNYGYAFHWGKNAPLNRKEAAKWFHLSANQGHVAPMYYLATYYQNGSVADGAVPKDLIESYKWLHVSLERVKTSKLRKSISSLKNKVSDEISMIDSGKARYRIWKWVPQKSAKAGDEKLCEKRPWLKAAAKPADAKVQAKMRAAMAAFPAPTGAPKPKAKMAKKKDDPVKAVHDLIAKKELEKAAKRADLLANRGNPKAQILLAKMYLSGQGIFQNDSMAWHWNMKAALKKVPEGQYQVGSMFENGQGVPTNIEDAVKWYEAAAKQGHIEAQISLGKIYAGWQSAYRMDVIRARKWLLLATGQGSIKAAGLLDKLEATYMSEPKAQPESEPEPGTKPTSQILDQRADTSTGSAGGQPKTEMVGKSSAPTLTDVPQKKEVSSKPTSEMAKSIPAPPRKVAKPQLDPPKTEEERLRRAVIKMLEATATQSNKVNFKGKVRVLEQDAGTFLVIIPSLSIDRHDGSNILFPPFRADVSLENKLGKSGEEVTSAYHLAVKLPKNIRLKGKGSNKEFPLKFDQKRMDLTWVIEHSTFSKVDMEIVDLLMIDPWENVTVKVNRIINKVSLTESKPGIFDGPSTFEMTGIVGSRKKNEGLGRDDQGLRIKKILFNTTIANFDSAGIQALMERLVSPTVPARKDTATTIKIKPSGPPPTATFKGHILNLVVTDSQEQPKGSVADLSLSGGLNLDDVEGSVFFSYAHKDLKYRDAVGDQKTFLPVDASFGLKITRLPVAEIQEMVLGLFSGGGGGNSAIMLGTTAGMRMHPLLETAGSIIALNAQFNAPEIGVTFDSSMTPNGAARYKATGEMNIAIRGMDVLLKWVEEHPEKAKAANIWLELAEHSHKSTDAKGATIDSFKLNFREQGYATVNGKELTELGGKKTTPQDSLAK